MTIEELKNLDNEVVTEEQANEIEADENVTGFENLGESTSHAGWYWIDVTLADNTHIDIFTK